MSLFDFFRALPTPDSFAALVMRQVRARGQAQKLVYDTKQFRILLGEKGQQIFNLENAFRDYYAAPRRMRAEVLRNYLAGMNVPALPSSFAEAKSCLMPVIRSRILCEYVRLQALAEPQRPQVADAFCALDDDTVIMLAYTSDSSITIIGHAPLAQWGVTFNVALAAAMDNLRQRTPNSFVDLGDGLLVGEWKDD